MSVQKLIASTINDQTNSLINSVEIDVKLEKIFRSLNLNVDDDVLDSISIYKHYVLVKILHYKTGRKRQIFMCGYSNCNKNFKKKCNFNDHVMVHQRSRPFKCKYCHKGHVQKGNCQRHQKKCFDYLLNINRSTFKGSLC